MNDRYLYRAKRIFDGKWVEGFLTKINRQLHIVNQSGENAANQIDESTICQCTGLKDKNGNLIFEHDIVSDECGNVAEIIWNDAELQYLVDYEFEPMALGEWCSVVGNIFDNPELLE